MSKLKRGRKNQLDADERAAIDKAIEAGKLKQVADGTADGFGATAAERAAAALFGGGRAIGKHARGRVAAKFARRT